MTREEQDFIDGEEAIQKDLMARIRSSFKESTELSDQAEVLLKHAALVNELAVDMNRSLEDSKRRVAAHLFVSQA